MCLIIASQSGQVPEQELIHTAWEDNPDGWGIMTAEGGRVRVRRGLERDPLLRAFDELRVSPRPYVAHYRWATHGEKDLENCHPFKIQANLYMAHNGIINTACPNKKRSDTWHFAQLLRKESWKAHHLLEQRNRHLLATEIGHGNKLVFLDNLGNISIINESAGLWHTPDIWLSNDHSLPRYHYFFTRYRGTAPDTCDFCNHSSQGLVKIYNEYLCETCVEYYEAYALEEAQAYAKSAPQNATKHKRKTA